MYEDAARRRVTLYVRRDASGNGETAFRHATDDGVDVFYWIDRDFGYALSGQIAASDLRKLAGLAYGQMAGGAQH
jgi:anti-sigma factor RsiW